MSLYFIVSDFKFFVYLFLVWWPHLELLTLYWIKTANLENGEVFQLLRTLSAILEGQGLTSSMQLKCLTVFYKSIFWGYCVMCDIQNSTNNFHNMVIITQAHRHRQIWRKTMRALVCLEGGERRETLYNHNLKNKVN